MNLFSNTSMVSDYIQRIYQAVLNPGSIYDVVNDLRHAIDAPYGAFQVENIHTHQLVESFLIDYDDSAIETYADYFIERDPWTIEVLKRGLINQGFQASQRLISDKVYRETEFYQDWGRSNGVRHAIGTSFEIESCQMLKVCFQRHSDQSEFDSSAENFLNILHPHFQRFVQLSNVFNEYDCHQIDVSKSFDYIDRPVWIVDKSLNIVYHNSQADEWMKSGCTLTKRQGKLSVLDYQQNKTVSSMISKLSSGMDGLSVFESCDAVRIDIGSPMEEESFWVSPFSNGDSDTSLILVTGRKPMPNTEIIQKHHGLSKRQAEIAVLMLQGMSMQEVSNEMNISINTVRNTLTTCFKKLNVNNQSELIMRLFGH